MSLLTRAVMLIAIIVLSISLSQGLSQLVSPEPSPLDELVATRNLRRAMAYRFVDLRGGRVAKTATTDSGYAPTSQAESEGLPGSEIHPLRSLIAVELNEYLLAEAALMDELKQLREGGEGQKGLDELRNEIATNNKDRRENMSTFKDIENSIVVASSGLASRFSQLKYTIATLLETDYKDYVSLLEQQALRAEIDAVRIDIARAKDQLRRLEEENYLRSRQYDRTVSQISRYESLDPSLGARSARVGKPWLHGIVTSVDPDPRVGRLVISIGSQDGVEPGQVFSIRRDRNFVAHIRVDSLERNRAICVLTEEFRGRARVLANDRVAGVANFGQFEDE